MRMSSNLMKDAPDVSPTRDVVVPPIWVVNLKRSVKRRDYIVQHLTDLGLDFELVEAVEGRDISEEEMQRVYSRDEAVRHIGRALTPGEIGGSLSHIKLYERMVSEGLDEVIIVEDDVEVFPSFWELLRNRSQFPPDWELILLYHGGAQASFWKRQKIRNGLELRKFATVVYGTVGYMITRGGAEKLLAQAYPIRVPSDGLTGGSLPTGLHLFGAYPLCMTQHGPGGAAESTMPDAHAARIAAPDKDSLGVVRWNLYVAKTGLFNFVRRLSPWAII